MLDGLLYPESVAVIGASRSPEKVGSAILSNLIGGGYKGKIIPVNPTTDELFGLPCYKDVRDAGITVDHCVVVVPQRFVMDALAGAAAVGSTAATVITAGFKEVGAEGAAKEREMLEFCQEHGIRILGPNCLGLINTENSMNASFSAQMPIPGHISVLSQSGALCTAILDWAEGRGVGLAKLLSIGNKADISETDLLRALAQDKQTRVIAAYLESITDGPEFIQVAEEVSQQKPVVILKAGTTEAGGKAAASHTGSLAGADIAYGAAFTRAGVVRADNFEALFDYASAFAMQPLPKGNRVAVITNAGGPGIMAADAVETLGMRMESLTPEISEKVKGLLPAAASVANPIDVLGDAQSERYAMAVKEVLADPKVDSAIVILTPQAMSDCEDTAQAIIDAEHHDKPVLTCFMGGSQVMDARNMFVKAGVPDYPSPERAVAALKSMVDYAAWLDRPSRVVTRFPVNRHRVERIFARQKRSGRVEMGEVEAKEILKAYDFNVPAGALARTGEEAVAIAQRVGFPVVMKIVSPDLLHKSDFGGVKLNLNSAGEVMDAFDLMMLRIRRRAPEAYLRGVLVEKMGNPGREVILGMHRDPQFGPMLMFGLGGIFVEVMKDVAFYLAPLTHDEALEMLKNTRSYALLRGVRGQAGVDLNAIASALQRISQLVTDFPQIEEMDINPFMVGEVGTTPYVADARMILSGE
ncbi:MAG: CoA-binding protein [Candidatus Hydrogenedens sp.]|nr:CoA-binding protein [Candidatus Hydrogenedens sp.]